MFCPIRNSSYLISLLTITSLAYAIDYRVIDRDHLESHIQAMNRQRIEFYSAYPYLFVCEAGEATEDVAVFLNCAQTLMVGAFDHDELIGFIMGVPLKDFNVMTCGAVEKDLVEAHDTFKDIPVALDDCYYLSEMCVKSGYDRDVIADELFKRFEAALIDAGMSYNYLCMIVLELPQNHPMRPNDPAQRWVEREVVHLANNGFIHTDYTIVYEWPTLQLDGSVKMQKNPMNFWYKQVNTKE